jgi:hypothetical protein
LPGCFPKQLYHFAFSLQECKIVSDLYILLSVFFIIAILFASPSFLTERWKEHPAPSTPPGPGMWALCLIQLPLPQAAGWSSQNLMVNYQFLDWSGICDLMLGLGMWVLGTYCVLSFCLSAENLSL